MNGEFPNNNPRAELEARVTAFILGELPAHEAAALRQAMDEDAELSRLYDRLKETIARVREATANPVLETKETPAPLRLSEERREKLLAHFKTVEPKDFVPEKPKRIPARRLLEMAAVVAIIGVLAGLLLPSLAKSKAKAVRISVASNLRQIDLAKKMWADDNKKTPEDVPTASDIAPYLGGQNGGLPRSVEGETYNIGRVGESPTADIKGRRRISLDGQIASVRQDRSVPEAKLSAPMLPPQPAQAVATTKGVTPGKRDLLEDIMLPPQKTAIVLPQTAETGTLPSSSYADNTLTWNPGSGGHSNGDPANGQIMRQGFVDLSVSPNAKKEPPEELQSEVITLTNAKVQDVEPVLRSLLADSSVQSNAGIGSAFQDGPLFGHSQSFQSSANSSTATPFGGAGGSAGGRPSETVAPQGGGTVVFQNSGVDDPDWIGSLEHPDQRQAGSNQFLARGADIALPQGQKLDLDYIHNQAGSQNPEFRFYTDVNGNGTHETNPSAPSIDPATGLPIAQLSQDGSLNTTFDSGPGVPLASPGEDELRRAAKGEPPPNVNIHAKFANITQEDNRALGFNFQGENATNAAIATGRTAPGFNNTAGSDYASNPSGAFPGTAIAQSIIANEGVLTNPEVTTESGRLGVVNGQAALTYQYQQTNEGIGAWSLSGTVKGFYADNYDISGETKNDASQNVNKNLTLTTPPASAAEGSPTSASTLGWTPKMHNQFGNVGVADGSVQQFTVNGLRTFANHTADTNADSDRNVKLFFPGDEREALQERTNNQKAPAEIANDSLNGYSISVVGYVNIPLTNGITMHANPLDSNGLSSTNGVLAYDNLTRYRNLTNEAGEQQPAGAGFFGRFRGETNYPNSTDLGAVTVTVDPDTKRTFFITDADTSESVSNAIIQLDRNPAGKDGDVARRLDEQIKQQEAKVDGLRKEFNVADTEEQSTQPGSSLGPVNVTHYNSLKIDAQTQYVKQEKLLNDLQKMDKEQLKEALPKVSPDPILKGLVQGQADAETRLAKLKKELGPDNPEVKRAEKEDDDYNQEINSRIHGVMQGLEVQSKAYLAQMQNADKLKEARTNDIGIAEQVRPYYEAKEELARLKTERATLAVNDSTKIPINYAKATDISDALKALSADDKKAESNPAYHAKLRELETLKKEQEVMALIAAQANEERTLPTKPMFAVIERADDKKAQDRTIGQRISQAFTGKVTETAKLKIERDVTDVPGVAGKPDLSGIYDPYFVQTEFEAIQSEKVLDRVIDKLKLDEAWAKKKGSNTPLTRSETRALLKKSMEVTTQPNTSLIDIKVKGDEPAEAAKIANTIADVYTDYRKQQREAVIEGGQTTFKNQLAEQNKKIAKVEVELAQLEAQSQSADAPFPKPAEPAPIPQPEVSTSNNAFSTFSLNIADVSFKLAAASLEKDRMPEPASIRSEEFINAFDYRDAEPAPGAPLGFAWGRARYPFAHNRDLLRFSVKTAAAGREAGRPMNIVLLLDKSGSMERADRVKIIHEALRVLATQLGPQDKISVVTFARTARLWVDGLPGNQASEVADGLDKLTPEGGTNLEDAMRLAYETARRHYIANGINRVVLLTDGAANLGNVDPESLKQKAEKHRKEGVALDCFGVGWEGYNDDLLEVLSRNGGGRYGFLNTPEEAANGFGTQLAGALHVAASDLKVQVEFNPKRVTAYRQIGYAKHQLTKEQFRDNTVAAAQVGAAESGNALYVIEVNPNGDGPIATVRVRYKVPGTEEYPEHEWVVPYEGNAPPLDQSSPAMRLAATASAFSEWLAASPFAGEVTTEQLLGLMRGVPETYGADERPKKLEWMIRQAKSLSGK